MDGLGRSSDEVLPFQYQPNVNDNLPNTPAYARDADIVKKSYQPQTSRSPGVDNETGNDSAGAVEHQDATCESSPLLPARMSRDMDSMSSPQHVLRLTESDEGENEDACVFGVDDRQDTKSSVYLFLLSLSMVGLSIAWSVELSNGSPYFLSLGISKSLLAIVWIAGPLSGALVQPYVGMKSDRCRSRFGRRRPFMVGGAIATAISLMALAWAKEIVNHCLGAQTDGRTAQRATVIFAVWMIYALDFGLNVLQASSRALIVDNAPAHQQDSANAWAMQMSCAGNIVGYLLGYADLPKHISVFGNMQFKVLCALASLAVLLTVSICCFSIPEHDPRLDAPPQKQEEGLLAFFRHLYRSVRRLPNQIKAVCLVQFFAFLGWFPFLFYTTTYIGELYVRPIFDEDPNMSQEQVDALWERATRRGTFALYVFAITTFAASVVLPLIVLKSSQEPENGRPTPTIESPNGARTRTSGYFSNRKIFRSGRARRLVAACCRSMRIKGFTLPQAWLLSHLLFATLMWLTVFVRTTTGATILVSFVGILWAMTNWAPFALIATEIRKHDPVRPGRSSPPSLPSSEQGFTIREESSDIPDQTGVVLGIHNVAIAAPQVLATLISSAIFRALQKPRGSVGDESVAWVLRFGGVAATLAAWWTRKVEH